MKSRAVLIAFVAFVALTGCRSTLDHDTSGSLCASTTVTCAISPTTKSPPSITCGPYEICDTSGSTPVCRCGSTTFTTTADATGCACSGTDSANPGCGNLTSVITAGAQCSPPDMTSIALDDSVLGDMANNADIETGPRQCASAMTPVMCGVVLCPTGAWCDASTPSSPVCRCGSADASASSSCMCSTTADPNNTGCLLGPVSGC